MSAAPVRETVEFATFPSGRLLRCLTEPMAGPARGAVMLLPPFGEEMNKTRALCAKCARELAVDGWLVARLDLYGCGDSAGELRDATWQGWIDDLAIQWRWLRERTGGPAWLWAVRGGALFLDGLLEVATDANLLLWQPVLQGATQLQQFLRLGMAASLLGAEGPEAAPKPADELAAGKPVEIAGYELSPALAGEMRAAKARPEALDGRGRAALWCEVGQGDAAAPSPAAQRATAAWRQAGWNADTVQVDGPPYWQNTEIATVPELIERSRAALVQGLRA